MKITVVGIGRMGGWLARELAKKHTVAVYDIDPDKMATVPNTLALDSLEALSAFDPELLINAVTLQHTATVFAQLTPYVSSECVVADIASIKGDIAAWYARSGHRFASIHPMFGPTAANGGGLQGHNAILIKESDPSALQFFRGVFQHLGVQCFEYTFDEHDRMMAYSLTTPFAATLVFAACMENNTVPGTTFAKHRGIAHSLLTEDDHLLAEILFNTYSMAQLEKITARLEFLKHVIHGRDFEEMQRFLAHLRENVG